MSDGFDQNFTDLMTQDQPESSNLASADFEKFGAGVHDSQGAIPEQDGEVTTTSYSGEEPAEEDRYAAGASDEAVESSSNPLISLGDEEDNSVSRSSAAMPDSEGSVDGYGGVAIGALATAGAEPSFQPPSPQALSSNPSQENEAVTSTQSQSEAPPETEETQTAQWLKNVDPRAPSIQEELAVLLDLIYWRDVRKTGVVFGSMMLVLLSLAFFSLLSVLAYLSLAILTVTLSFRVYKNIMAAVQKTNDGHPFKQYLDLDITLKEEKVSRVTQTVLQHVNRNLLELRRLFLIEDLVDSIKFGLLLWVLTYVGAWFNGMTLVILLVVAVFSLPKVYEMYKVQIDHYLNMATTQVNSVLAQVQSKLPFLKKKAKAQ